MQKKLIKYGFVIMLLSSCKLLGLGGNTGSSASKQESACPSDGRNIGAEKLLSDNKKLKKAPKYTKDKPLIY
jgi:hypothetical protein